MAAKLHFCGVIWSDKSPCTTVQVIRILLSDYSGRCKGVVFYLTNFRGSKMLSNTLVYFGIVLKTVPKRKLNIHAQRDLINKAEA